MFLLNGVPPSPLAVACVQCYATHCLLSHVHFCPSLPDLCNEITLPVDAFRLIVPHFLSEIFSSFEGWRRGLHSLYNLSSRIRRDALSCLPRFLKACKALFEQESKQRMVLFSVPVLDTLVAVFGRQTFTDHLYPFVLEALRDKKVFPCAYAWCALVAIRPLYAVPPPNLVCGCWLIPSSQSSRSLISSVAFLPLLLGERLTMQVRSVLQ